MNTYYFINIPTYFIDKLCAVRTPLDNLWNILTIIEAINSHPESRTDTPQNGFDIAVFTKGLHRFVVNKDNGYFSMANPFQVNFGNDTISFNCDQISEPVSGKFIAIMKNAIQTVREYGHSYDDIVLSFDQAFGFEWKVISKYIDAFFSILSEDHGYFRFDDDIDNVNGDIHPRYHFDVFFKNTCSLKVGYDRTAELQCFLSLADKTQPKKYLVDAAKDR